jgi:glyoxylase-like metal-dependent hydrolase (beta-lactamase superfamily II)
VVVCICSKNQVHDARVENYLNAAQSKVHGDGVPVRRGPAGVAELEPSIMITRRACLTGGAALAAGVTGGSASRIARAQTAPAAHAFKVGTFEVTVVSDGGMAFPVSFILPSVVKPDVDAVLAANGLPLDVLPGAVNVTIIKTATDLIVVDAGGGDFLPGLGKFADAVETAGIKPDAVTKVIFTHAHADHLWGVIDPLDDATRFPNADHFMSVAEHNFWSAAETQTRIADAFKPMAIGTQRRLNLLGRRLVMVKPGFEIVPGITLVDTAGHTPGHVSVLLTSGGNQLLIGGDVLSQAVVSFAKPDWRWGPDLDPDAGAASRRRTLDMLATDRIALLGYHLPWPGVGRVERKDAAFRFIQT